MNCEQKKRKWRILYLCIFFGHVANHNNYKDTAFQPSEKYLLAKHKSCFLTSVPQYLEKLESWLEILTTPMIHRAEFITGIPF